MKICIEKKNENNQLVIKEQCQINLPLLIRKKSGDLYIQSICLSPHIKHVECMDAVIANNGIK